MSVSYLWLDTETTGLDFNKNDIIQIAAIPIVNGQKKKPFVSYIRPINFDNIDEEALRVNNISRSQLSTFPRSDVVLDNLINYLSSFNTKFTISGYNVGFDRDFIYAWFYKHNKQHEFSKIFTSNIRDTYKLAKTLKSTLNTNNLKLETLANNFNIEIKAHDALSDIEATIEIDKILMKMAGEDESDTVVINDVHVDDSDLSGLIEPAQLHMHSMYSYVDSFESMEAISKWCEENSVPGFATPDHIMGTSLFYATKKSSVPFIPSLGLFVNYNGSSFFINAWAVSNKGYENLIYLSSKGWDNKTVISEVEFPTLSLEEIIQNKEGLIFGLPGTNGPVVDLLEQSRYKEAESLILDLTSKLDHVFLELAAIDVVKKFNPNIGFSLFKSKEKNIQRLINVFYKLMHDRHGLKLIPVSDSHFLNPEDKIIQDVVMRISFKDQRCLYESRHALLAKDMFKVLKRHLGDAMSVEFFNSIAQNTLHILELSKNVEVSFSYHLPEISIPDHIKAKTSDYKQQTYLLLLEKVANHGRWNPDPVYVERFKKEIDTIMNNDTINFIPYFLVYEDICSYTRANNLLQGIARGSAGGSLVSYYLKITHIDPVKAKLPFERFLSKARIRAGSFPDIDLDLADKARPIIMDYLQKKYNRGFAQIATFQKMKTKNAIKDAAFALYGRNRNDIEIKKVCDTIEDSPQGINEHDFLYGYTDLEGKTHKGVYDLNSDLRNFFERYPELKRVVDKLIGTIRGYSRHASAFVISTLNLERSRVPIMIMTDKDIGDIRVAQYDASMIEKSGLVKADILGVKTISMISECVNLIKLNKNEDLMVEENGVPFIYRLPDEDKNVFDDFKKQDTDSSFQFNTELVKSFLPKFAPRKKSDLAAITSLCRPGALDAPFEDTTATQHYLNVRNDPTKLKFLHKDLEPILKESNGIFQYQEEVIQFLVDVVGYTWEQADIIRSAIAKKKQEVIMSTFDKIRESCSQRGWDKESIEKVCQQVLAFSNYSFNKSHAYAYAELGYITMYLKHYYPLEWWTSVLNNEDSEDKIKKFLANIESKGIRVISPSIKRPSNKFSIRGNAIAVPLSSVKSIGESIVDELIKKAPFDSIEDFISKVDHSKVNIQHFSVFLKAGLLDEFIESQITEEPEKYFDERDNLLKKYLSIRGIKKDFDESVYTRHLMSIYKDRVSLIPLSRESLISDKLTRSYLLNKYPFIHEYNKDLLLVDTNILDISNLKKDMLNHRHAKHKHLFVIKQKVEDLNNFVLLDVKTMSAILDSILIDRSKHYGSDMDKETMLYYNYIGAIGIIGFMSSCTHKKIKSKKDSKEFDLLEIEINDGVNSMSCALWNREVLKIKENELVFAYGFVKRSWKGGPSMDIKEIFKLEEINEKYNNTIEIQPQKIKEAQ